MGSLRTFTGFLTAVLIVQLGAVSCETIEYCNPKPFQSNFDPLEPDNRFYIEIEDILNDEFIPGEKYKVILASKDEKSEFVAFTISATGSSMPDPMNERKQLYLNAGRIDSIGDSNNHDTIKLLGCQNKNIVVEANKQPKRRVEVQWTAPMKDNKCVTIWAYVAVKPDVWYTNTGPLSKRVCEDVRQKADMKPKETRNCVVCQDARYELEFQGTWSLNTHLNMYPENSSKIVRFSDIVGASHGKGFILYDEQSVASQGLKMLAEQGNTTLLERDILKFLPNQVRTVIKANGPYNSTSSTVTSFRTSREKHFISLAASVIPSSDWFVGVIDMELCDDNQWIKEYVYNLYPMDAGTDSGVGFEDAPEPTTPPQPIKKVDGSTKPFAKLKISLVRVYDKECEFTRDMETTSVADGGSYTETPVTSRATRPTIIASSEPPTEEPNPDMTDSPVEGCETTDFGPYTPCGGPCVDGKRSGWRMRERSLIDIEATEKCEGKYESHYYESCEEDCTEEKFEDETATETDPQAQQSYRDKSVKPGQSW